MGLLDTNLATVNAKKTRNSDRIYEATPIDQLRTLSLLSDFAPVIGGVKGAVEEWGQGNKSMAALNAATVPLDLLSFGTGGALAKLGLLGMVKRGKDFDKLPKMLAEIDDAYKATGDIKKLKKVEAAVLDQDEVAAFNAKRFASQPKLADGSLEYNGRHHYKSRGDTPEGNGYTVDDMVSQLDSVTFGKLVPQVDRAGVAMKQPVKRDDGYGKQLNDKMSIMVSPEGKGELYSVVPDDGLRKGQKVQNGLLGSGDQAHPISDGVRIEASEPLNNTIAPQNQLTQYGQAQQTFNDVSKQVEQAKAEFAADKSRASLNEYNRLLQARDDAQSVMDGWRPASAPVESNYKGEHGAPMKDSGAPLNNIAKNGYYPDDVYGPNGLRYYGTGDDKLDSAAYSVIRQAQGNPFAQVKMYRAVPTDAPAVINNGDWVTTVKQYAKDHGEGALNGDYRIVSKTVPAKKLFTNGDSWLEFGYDESGKINPELLGAIAGGGLLGLGGYKLIGDK